MQIRKINNCKILKTTVLILLLVLFPILYNLNIVAAENTSENNKSDIIILKTEVIPSQNGEKIRKNYFSNGGYEEICIDKNGKTKKWVSYDKSGNLLIEIIYDDYGGEVIHLPDWSIELLKEKELYIERSQNEPLLDEPDDVKMDEHGFRLSNFLTK
ncbi:hypothetical protein ELD05_06715 [Caldicellulosiruptor changbaiensis]|uniref:Uncharacterized protein n=1 Tax=Caldicellulosiruptor changbaiensis TaxID=1222016 RepID=A0A3T0D5L1_9FIRM|nr:hypothetical protein [Caldicellulosiruptor changbaiensis]AZT90355.1 hypothetical protein ELD05_06715 [Caldicellulosiruptor changbaiensis]